MLFIFRVLHNGVTCPPSGSLARDPVLEGYRQEVPFILTDFGAFLLEDRFHEVDHVLVALSLFCYAGHEDLLFNDPVLFDVCHFNI